MDEREKRAAFCGGKAALVLSLESEFYEKNALRVHSIKREEPVIFLKDHRQIMKKILSKCKQQQQLHLTFISISAKCEESLARL